MREIKNILFPVELSPISGRIVPQVRYRAEKFGAEVHIVHVLADPAYFATVYYVEAAHLKPREVMIKDVEDELDRFCLQNDLQAHKAVLMGDTVEGILEYVKGHDIDQIIMGTHGRNGLERIIIGSVARRVVRRSPVPVLTINPFLMDQREKTKEA